MSVGAWKAEREAGRAAAAAAAAAVAAAACDGARRGAGEAARGDVEMKAERTGASEGE